LGKLLQNLSRPVLGTTDARAGRISRRDFSQRVTLSRAHTHKHTSRSRDENKNVNQRHAPGLSNTKRDGKKLFSDIEMGSCVKNGLPSSLEKSGELFFAASLNSCSKFDFSEKLKSDINISFLTTPFCFLLLDCFFFK